MEKEYTQPSFLKPNGTIDQKVVDAIELQDRFRTEGQVKRAQELIASGEAKNAQEAWEIMAKKDAEEDLEERSYTHAP